MRLLFNDKLLLLLAFAFLLSCAKDTDSELNDEERQIRDYLEEMGIHANPTESGLYFIEEVAGDGDNPSPGDFIMASYTVSLICGRVVQTTDETTAIMHDIFSPNRLYGPHKFKLDDYPVNGVKEGLQMMQEGGAAMLIIPSRLAYGSTQTGNIPPDAVLVYEIELTEVIQDPVLHEEQLLQDYLTNHGITEDPLESGVFFIEHTIGSGEQYAEMEKGVALMYTGKFIDGRVFDSSGDNPAEFILGRNIMLQSLEEALTLMKPGGQATFIIPSAFAFGAGGDPSLNVPPHMTLIYEVELVEVFDTYPGSTWTHWESFEDAGFDPTSQYIIESKLSSMNTTGVMVVKDGRVLLDYGNLTRTTYLASVRKSILSMMYGKYVEDGTINLELSLEDLGINDNQGLLAIEKQATIRDIISARSGVYHPPANTGDDSEYAPPRGSVEPGTYFLYNNWDFNVAGGIFQMLTSANIYDALRDDLAIPLQMQDFDRNEQVMGGNSSISQYLAYHMYISTRDLARLGLLMLNKGRWLDQQIIPEDWVEESTSIITPVEEMNPEFRRDGYYGYGYMWWVFDGEQIPMQFQNAYTAIGAYGQFLSVFPDLNIVVAHKTEPDAGTTTGQQYFELLQLIVNAKMN